MIQTRSRDSVQDLEENPNECAAEGGIKIEIGAEHGMGGSG